MCIRYRPTAVWNSVLTPDILSVLKIVPERMSLLNLSAYIEHLRESRQKATRFEIALWQKIVYPAAAIVMMVLAIPFAIQSQRAGGTGAKIVLGILLGLGFHFAGRLFSHVGLLNDWPAAVSAGMPTLIFFLFYTSDAADQRTSVDLGWSRVNLKQKQ